MPRLSRPPAPILEILTVLTLGIAASVCVPGAVAGAPPVVAGDRIARLSITLEHRGDTAVVPGPFTVLPDGKRVAIDVPESDGILLVEGDRILHHFPLPANAAGIDGLAASSTLLVAGRRPRDGPTNVDLFVFDLQTGLFVERIESANPFLRAPAEGRDTWRIVVDGDRVGVFEPTTAATYPLWDRGTGFIVGSQQVVQSTAGLGFGDSAKWIPNPDGSVDRKVRGRSEPFASAGEGEFLGDFGEEGIVLLQSAGDPASPPTLPRELVVHALEGERAIAELRVEAVDPAVDSDRRLLSGRPAQVSATRLYWVYLGPDYLEVRAADLPRAGD